MLVCLTCLELIVIAADVYVDICVYCEFVIFCSSLYWITRAQARLFLYVDDLYIFVHTHIKYRDFHKYRRTLVFLRFDQYYLCKARLKFYQRIMFVVGTMKNERIKDIDWYMYSQDYFNQTMRINYIQI